MTLLALRRMAVLTLDALSCSGEVSRETSNHEAWQEGRLLTVGNARYVVEVNPPTVQKVSQGAC